MGKIEVDQREGLTKRSASGEGEHFLENTVKLER